MPDAMTPAERKHVIRDIMDMRRIVEETEAALAELLADWQHLDPQRTGPVEIAEIQAKAKTAADLHARCIDSYKYLIKHPELRTVAVPVPETKQQSEAIMAVIGVLFVVIIGLVGALMFSLAVR